MDSGLLLSRKTLLWLISAALFGVIAHLWLLPLWVGGVAALCLGWRYQVTEGRWHLPGKWLRFLLVLSAVTGVLLQYGTLLGPSAGTALLLLGYTFKLLETQERRDGFLVVVLGFVVIAAVFFFEQSMLITAYAIIGVWLLVAALVQLNQHHDRPFKQLLGTAGKLLLQALPLMLVLFLLVPRIAPIWSLDLAESRAKTGLSDQVNVGDIASLSQSDEIAFRAVFEGEQPRKEQLYWRALVLDQYDGSTWSRGSFAMDEAPMVSFQGPNRGWHQQVTPLTSPITYQVMMEPTDRPWLFSLAGVTQFDRNQGYSLDHRMVNATPVSQPLAYRVSSALDYQLDLQLPQWLLEKNRQLPLQGDPKTRELAAKLWSISSDPERYIDQVLQYFASGGFRYTLRPGQLTTDDQVDEFLFQQQQGFCSHYAGAFVYLMRAAGLPARMVAGYQGGEYSELGGYWLVHQFDAHAWVEVWIANKGWVRVDPTAMISPSRINEGLENAVANEQSFLAESPFSAARYRHLAWLSQLRYSLDYINYAWYRAVLGYDAQLQMDFLSRWLGAVNIKTIALWLLGSVLVVLTLLSLFLLRRPAATVQHPLLKEYLCFCSKMKKRGYPRQPQETPQQYALRLQQLLPDKQQDIGQLSALFQRSYYGHEQTAKGEKLLLVFRRLAKRI